MITCTAPPTGLRRVQGDDGAALVEFALVLPLLLMLLLGMVGAGLAWNQQLQLTHATREAARLRRDGPT